MSEQAKNLIPKSRFPEFQKASKWVMKPLKGVAQLLDGDWIESKDQSAYGVRLIQTGNIGVGDFIPKDGNARFISEETFRRLKCSEVVPGDCLISRLPDPAGRSCLVPDIGSKMITAVDCTIVRFDLERIIPYFFISFSQTDQYFSEIQAQASGSTRLRISRDNLSNIEIPLAALPEQQKIADCLSSIDDLITAQNQKVEALKQHKKGLMQQLFPAEGETDSKLRFPEFENDGAWPLTHIGKFIEEYRKNSTRQDEYEVLTSAREGLLRQRDYFDNDRIAERDNIGFNVIPPGYLTYRSRSDDKRFYFNENLLGFTGIISTYYPVFKIQNGVNKFFVELLARYSEHVGKHSVGTSQTVLSLNVLKKIELPVPCPEEQKKIADCLSSLDELISIQTQRLDALKTHKKGLMQQLFPSTNEVDK